jgi:hypothetical protein
MVSAITILLILHGLAGLVLLGAITFQLVSIARHHAAPMGVSAGHHTRTNQLFVAAIIFLYVAQIILGAILYPAYRPNVRIPLEDMFLFKAVGIFQTKEYFAGIGMVLLPLYFWLWRPAFTDTCRRDRLIITSMLAFILWWDFLVGHVLNNLQGSA